MRRLIFLFIAFLTLSTDLVEYTYMQKIDTQAKERATYLYGFTKYFEWPGKDGNFIITVIGENNGLMAELTNLAKTKTVGSQKIEVQNHQSIKDANQAHIIFITPDKSGLLIDAIAKFKGKGTLIVTEKTGSAKIGSAINFVIEENKSKFQLNKSAVAKAGLNVASSLEKMAVSVIN